MSKASVDKKPKVYPEEDNEDIQSDDEISGDDGEYDIVLDDGEEASELLDELSEFDKLMRELYGRGSVVYERAKNRNKRN